MRTQILLYFPNFRLDDKFNTLSHQQPLSLGYLARALKNAGIEYEILDAAAENLNYSDIINRIKLINPIYIGITSNIAISNSVINQSKLFRKFFPEIKLIMGGPWATGDYKYLLENNYSDCVVLGEGELSLIELMQIQEWNDSHLKSINGIAYKINDSVITTKERVRTIDLDKFSYPLWEKFPIKKYDVIHREKPYFPIITSRGCPYDCINCTKIIHGYTVRNRSVDNIIEELKYLKEHYNCKEIMIMDDGFNINLNRAKQILRAIIKLQPKYKFQIQLMNGIRADKIDEDFAILLKRAGVYKVALGIESGSQAAVNYLGKKLDLGILKNIIDILHSHGIIVYGFFIFGIPIENANSFIYTINFADKIGIDFPYFFVLVPFPGTKLYDMVKIKDSDTIRNYHLTNLTFLTGNFTDKDIKKAKIYSMIRFFINPRRFLRIFKILTIKELFYFFNKFLNLIFGELTKSER